MTKRIITIVQNLRLIGPQHHASPAQFHVESGTKQTNKNLTQNVQLQSEQTANNLNR